VAFFKATVVLLALCFLDGSLAGRSRSPSPSRACQKCPTLQHPTQQCSIETLCDHGGCSIPLNRCGAEYLNAHSAHNGHKIDLKLFDKESNDNSYQEIIDDSPAYKEVYYDPDTKMIEFVTADHVRNTKKYKYLTAEDAARLPVVEATTNSLDDELIENVTDEDDFAEVNAPPKSRGGTTIKVHIHKVGCRTCGKHYLCEEKSDCTRVHRSAYCYKTPGSPVGRCYMKMLEITNNGWQLVGRCCET